MVLLNRYAFGICMVLQVLPYVFSIKCFDCRSSDDPKCADPFDNSTVPITDCKQEKGPSGISPTMCRKIKQKVNGVWQYSRGCAYLGEEGIQGDERSCLQRTGADSNLIESCTCDNKDGCNSSSLFSPMPLLLATLSSLTYLCKKIL